MKEEPKRKKIKIAVPDFSDMPENEFKRLSVAEAFMIILTIFLLILAIVQAINFMPEK